ncbi:MAG: Stp1/IreP family PP2C-type Ser/Thr phosphatase [Ruminococcaceae bacterium]|nr:Stp1/IreP family PP2C-type Ser/Thr phosphatase [Oscillospiraceae bacterium]
MIKWGGCTDLGQSRPVNEDGYYISDYSAELDAIYAIVADGMGGHQAGEVASALALRQVSEAINQGFCAEMSSQELKELLGTAVREANESIFKKSLSEHSCGGMGTTITLCFIAGEKAMVAHVGDSRAYILRGGTLHQITTDHSLVQELIKSGQITPEEAEHHPQKNVITRALGTDSGVDIDLYEFQVLPGDCILLCTDGLTNLVSEAEMTELLSGADDMNAISKQLIVSANQKGGYDNITAVVLKKD